MEEKLIFVTNDDGVNAKGLRHAIDVARKFGRVVAIAPEKPQSGMAHAITMHKPLHLRKLWEESGAELYSCSGTPVDCVKMAFDHLLRENRPSLAISGINHGSNSAISVLYSGTMAAAIESSFYGTPSIGLSLLDHDADADFTSASRYGEQIIGSLLSATVDVPLCLNVNVPAVPQDRIAGIKLCRQNRGYWKEEFFQRKDPRGRDYYWLTGDFFSLEPDAPDTDEWALAHNYVSVVPIQVDLTNHRQIESLKEVIK